MDLNILWFILIGVLFAIFFLLEGFDYGVGILLPFVGKTDTQRRVLLNSIGPFWDGNEVWMIAAGGAIFAAFPNWYATLFSGFYLALFFLLLALIVRGVSFEFRSKDDHPLWRKLWDCCLWIGSLVPAFLWGVVVANLIRGVPIDAQMHFTGTLLSLFSPFTVFAGVAFVFLFIYHGALFLNLRVQGKLKEQISKITPRLGLLGIIAMVIMAALLLVETDIAGKTISLVTLALAAIALIFSQRAAAKGNFRLGFIATTGTIILTVATVFTGLFPRVMVSSLDPAWSLTIYNASSTATTLKVMAIVALLLVPVIIGYQIWAYWIFRQPVDVKELEY